MMMIDDDNDDGTRLIDDMGEETKVVLSVLYDTVEE